MERKRNDEQSKNAWGRLPGPPCGRPADLNWDPSGNRLKRDLPGIGAGLSNFIGYHPVADGRVPLDGNDYDGDDGLFVETLPRQAPAVSGGPALYRGRRRVCSGYEFSGLDGQSLVASDGDRFEYPDVFPLDLHLGAAGKAGRDDRGRRDGDLLCAGLGTNLRGLVGNGVVLAGDLLVCAARGSNQPLVGPALYYCDPGKAARAL